MNKKITLIILIAIFFFSCNEKPEKILIGTWKLDSIYTNQLIPESESESYKKAIKEIKISTFLTFDTGSVYVASIWGDTTNGFWQVDENLILSITDANTGDTAETLIKNLTSKKIELEETSEGITSTLIFIKD